MLLSNCSGLMACLRQGQSMLGMNSVPSSYHRALEVPGYSAVQKGYLAGATAVSEQQAFSLPFLLRYYSKCLAFDCAFKSIDIPYHYPGQLNLVMQSPSLDGRLVKNAAEPQSEYVTCAVRCCGICSNSSCWKVAMAGPSCAWRRFSWPASH